MKTVRIQYRAKPIIKKKLEFIARHKKLTVSNLLSRIVDNYLKEEEPTIQFFKTLEGVKSEI